MSENISNPELAGLQEIALPEPISYTPQTIAWYVLFGLVLITAIWLYWRWYQRRVANRYRGEALKHLKEIELNIQDTNKRIEALMTLPVLVKQTVLAFAPRATVANLSGEAWLSLVECSN